MHDAQLHVTLKREWGLKGVFGIDNEVCIRTRFDKGARKLKHRASEPTWRIFAVGMEQETNFFHETRAMNIRSKAHQLGTSAARRPYRPSPATSTEEKCSRSIASSPAALKCVMWVGSSS